MEFSCPAFAHTTVRPDQILSDITHRLDSMTVDDLLSVPGVRNAAIRELVKQSHSEHASAIAASRNENSPVPVETIARVGAGLQQLAFKILDWQKDIEHRAQHSRKAADKSDNEEVVRFAMEEWTKYTRLLTEISGARQSMTSLIDSFYDSPELFLFPVGTAVEVVGLSEPVFSPEFLQESSKQYPQLGSQGVVIRPNTNGHGTIAVAFPDGYRDGYDTEYPPVDDSDDVPTFFFDRSALNNLGSGIFLDGSTCSAYDFVATHNHGDQDRPEMLVIAMERIWRLWKIGDEIYGPPVSYTDPSALSFLVDIETGQRIDEPLQPACP